MGFSIVYRNLSQLQKKEMSKIIEYYCFVQIYEKNLTNCVKKFPLIRFFTQITI